MAAFNWGAMLQGMTGAPIADIINGTQPPEAAHPFQPPKAPLNTLVEEQPPADITVSKPEERKGMFGVKGTLRDILGTLGDAFLVNAGRDPVYSPRRQQEKYADALGEGFNADNAMNAVDRLQQAGMGKEAMALYNQIQEQEVARQKAAAANSYQCARTMDQGYQNLGRLFAGADEKSFPALRAIAERRASMYGIDPSELPTDLAGAKRWGLDTYRNNRLEQFDDEQDLREQNVNNQMSNRNRNTGIAAGRAAEYGRHNRASEDNTRRGQDMTDARVRGSAGYTGKGRRAAPSSGGNAPPVGYKNKNGLTFKGGDPKDRNNWK